MTPDRIFALVNPLALAAWLFLAIVPRRAALISGRIVPAAFALLYAIVVATSWGHASGGFGSLPAVAQLFSNPWLLLAGWIHYLCFDLLIGTWEVRDARTRGIPHLLVLPCLALTFLFGPAGWLLYLGLSAVHARIAPAKA